MKTHTPTQPPSRYCLGLDISSQTFTAQLLEEGAAVGKAIDFANEPKGYRQLIQWLKNYGVALAQTHAVMEATGVYWEECALYLHGQGIRVNVINPAQIKAFANVTLRRSKTDRTDANLIARFGATMPLPLWQPPSLEMEALQITMRHREALIDMLTEEKNRLHALERRPGTPQEVIKTVKKHIAFMQQQVKNLDDTFKKKLKEQPEWQECYELLQSLPGVGGIIAAVLMGETGGMVSFMEARQLVAHAGIAPQQHESGTSVKRTACISKIGNARLRRAVYMAALSAIRCQGPLKDFYQRLVGRGKAKKLALVAVARKLLVLAFKIVRFGKPYDARYQAQKA